MEVKEEPEVPGVPAIPAAPAPAPAPVPVPEPAPRVRRRGRTTLIIATAAVLGLVAGTCVGYLVQADREPTKLPPLSQPVLPQAEGPEPEPLLRTQLDRIAEPGEAV